MSPLLMPVLRGSLPGFPVAPDPGSLAILVWAVLIPVLIAAPIVALGMGRRWVRHDPAKPAPVESASAQQGRELQTR